MPVAIIDLRNESAYFAGHLLGATHLPQPQLETRLNELPARPSALALVSNSEQELLAAEAYLTSKGYQISSLILAENSEKQPGLVVFIPFLQQKTRLDLSSISLNNADSKRLWQPSSVIQKFVEDFQFPALSKALDLGCGGGRDAVFLSLSGWQVTAIEHKAQVIERAQTLAKNHAQAINFYQCDLTQPTCLPQDWNESFDLVYGIRFLDRSLFPRIKQLIRPGGFVLWQTFSRGCEAFGSPKNPKFILQPGELSETFHDFKVIYDKIETLADGRPVASFVAQKA